MGLYHHKSYSCVICIIPFHGQRGCAVENLTALRRTALYASYPEDYPMPQKCSLLIVAAYQVSSRSTISL